MKHPILIVDDDKNIRYSIRRLLESHQHQVEEASSGEEALELVSKQKFSLILLDIQMGGMSGLETLTAIKKQDIHIPVIILTAFGTTQHAIEAIKQGAYEYILKPFDPEALQKMISEALSLSKMMQQEVQFPSKTEKKLKEDTESIIGNSPKMQEVYKMIGKVAQSNVTVLLRGESGTGKELVARAIYQHSKRADQLFLPINCAAIPANLLESELFGHEKGAFTGAQQTRIGKFEQCQDGTLFLDEIGDLELATQAKILRVLQEKELQRVGGNTLIKTNTRLIAATNRDLEKMIQKNQFREDLYYRLNVVTIILPPLRERTGDISLLVEYFIKKYTKELNLNKIHLSKGGLQKLKEYHWPGNVRELENCIQRSLVLARTHTLNAEDFVFTPPAQPISSPVSSAPISEDDLAQHFFNHLKTAFPKNRSEEVWAHLEKKLIQLALNHTNGNQLQAAKLLGFNRNTIRKKIAEYQIHIETKIS